MRFALITLIITIGIGLIFFLSWVSQPNLGSTGLIPPWLVQWTDSTHNDTIRTGVPFVFLGTLTGVWLTLENLSAQKWMLSWIGLVLVVIVAEAGQLFLPYRSFDWKDIGWGAFGAFVGLALAFLVLSAFNHINIRLKDRQ